MKAHPGKETKIKAGTIQSAVAKANTPNIVIVNRPERKQHYNTGAKIQPVELATGNKSRAPFLRAVAVEEIRIRRESGNGARLALG